MALSESAVSELLDAFRAGDCVDLIRESARLVFQELIEVGAAEVIGAGRYERTDERSNVRNGHRRRLLATQAGDIVLGIPKLRRGSFFPSILGHRRRIDLAVLGLDVGDSEDEVFWRGFLRSPKHRGLGGVRLVISDQHAGPTAAIRRCFRGAAHQRCRVPFADFARYLLAVIPKADQAMVAALFRTVFAGIDADAVAAQWDHVAATHAERSPKADALIEAARGGRVQRVPRRALAQDLVHEPPRAGQQGDQATLPGRGDLPERSLRGPLVGAVLADMHDDWIASDRRYLSEASMAKLYPERDNPETVTAELNTGD